MHPDSSSRSSHSSRAYLPEAPFLLACIVGILMFRWSPGFPNIWVWGMLLIAFSGWVQSKASNRGPCLMQILKKSMHCIGFACVAYAYAQYRIPHADPGILAHPIRAQVQFKVERLFGPSGNRCSGVGRFHSLSLQHKRTKSFSKLRPLYKQLWARQGMRKQSQKTPNPLPKWLKKRLYVPIYPKVASIERSVEAAVLNRAIKGCKLCFSLEPGLALRPGCLVQAKGLFMSIREDSAEPSNFDRFLARSHIQFRLNQGQDLQILSPEGPLQAFLLTQNKRLEAALQAGWGPLWLKQAAPLYTAMLLGSKQLLTKADKERFSSTGTMHFFAVSGLHVGVISIVLLYLLRQAGLARGPATTLMLCILSLYVGITGASPSSIRALMMITLYVGAQFLWKQMQGANALFKGALMVLLVDPETLFSPSFQLSYSVVAGILLYGSPLGKDLFRLCVGRDSGILFLAHPLRTRLLKGLLYSFGISLGATLGSGPFTLYYFNNLPIGGIFINMALMSAGSFVMSVGTLSLGFISIGLSELSAWINPIAWLCVWLMKALIDSISPLPLQLCLTDPLSSMRFACCSLASLISLIHGSQSKRRSHRLLSYSLPWIAVLALFY